MFIWLSTGEPLYCISTQPFSTTCEHHYQIISPGNEKFLVYTLFEMPCPEYNTRLRRVYVGIFLLVCIINLLVAPVASLLMRLGCQGKGTKNFSRQSDFFSTWTLSLWKGRLVETQSYSRIQSRIQNSTLTIFLEPLPFPTHKMLVGSEEN